MLNLAGSGDQQISIAFLQAGYTLGRQFSRGFPDPSAQQQAQALSNARVEATVALSDYFCLLWELQLRGYGLCVHQRKGGRLLTHAEPI